MIVDKHDQTKTYDITEYVKTLEKSQNNTFHLIITIFLSFHNRFIHFFLTIFHFFAKLGFSAMKKPPFANTKNSPAKID